MVSRSAPQSCLTLCATHWKASILRQSRMFNFCTNRVNTFLSDGAAIWTGAWPSAGFSVIAAAAEGGRKDPGAFKSILNPLSFWV